MHDICSLALLFHGGMFRVVTWHAWVGREKSAIHMSASHSRCMLLSPAFENL
jgi:hypothetical protein